MTRRGAGIAVLFVSISALGWCDAHADPKTGPIFKVCVLPPDATLVRFGMKGGESLSKESEDWAEKLDATVKHALTEAGAQIAGDLSPEELRSDEAARQSVVSLKQKYNSIAAQLRKKPGGVEKGRYTLGDEVALLPCAGQAESLAFVHASGRRQTNGKKTFDVLVGGASGLLMAQARYDIWVALVDAKSGEVTAFVHETATGGKTEMDPEDTLTKPLASEFRKVRVGWVRPQVATK